MLISSIIPTIGRPALARAVNSILQQQCDGSFEVIVVNDSAEPLPPADWRHDKRVTVLHTQQRERCVARNTGAAVAKGQYLHFLDDDDWLLPGAFQNLKALANMSSVRWLYGGSQLVDRRGRNLIELHHQMEGNVALQVMSGEWIPLQSSLFESSLFFGIGGFDPLIPGAEDIDFIRRAALQTPVAGTAHLVAAIGMGEEDSTTNRVRSARLISLQRERPLDQAGTFRRLRSGAISPYWFGRLTRIYLTSSWLNLRRGKMTTAASRSTYTVASLFAAGSHIFSASYWQAISRAYANETFRRGFSRAK